MKLNLGKKLIGLIVVLSICLFGQTLLPVFSYASLPDELRLLAGRETQLEVSAPVDATVSDQSEVLQVMKETSSKLSVSTRQHSIHLNPQQEGTTKLTWKLFGKIPLKTTDVLVVPDLKVVPGGQTIGVKVKSAGILVVGHHLVHVTSKDPVSPGEEAGIKLGDLLTHMNGKAITGVNAVADTVLESGKTKKPIDITLSRQGKVIKTKLTPVFDEEDQVWRLGLYIRDSAAGVGTLTFYAPDQGVYGALGHVITDMNTQTPIVVGSGEIVQSNVTSIAKSESGDPGEKRAIFTKESRILGNIERNTPFGIFGKMPVNPEHSLYQKPIPVAFAHEVKEGPAEILTVLEGQKVERFTVDVVHVSPQDHAATKGLVIRITDKRLIDKTGGIVQGMSGSPIIQNGKLIGAVTHVFVNDPKSGYGCFIEWMLEDAGVVIPNKQTMNLKAS